MDQRNDFRIGRESGGRPNGVSNLDVQVEEAVKKLIQSERHEATRPNSNARRRRQKSLPGLPSLRDYDWNTTHFFPDQHEVSVGLTFEVPERNSFDARGYLRNERRKSGNPTFISVSKDNDDDDYRRRYFVETKFTEAKSPVDFASAFPATSSSPSSSGTFVAQGASTNQQGRDSDEDESLTRGWQRSPVRRKSHKREVRPPSTELRNDALPPKGSPHSGKKGRAPSTDQPGRGFGSPGSVDSRSSGLQASSKSTNFLVQSTYPSNDQLDWPEEGQKGRRQWNNNNNNNNNKTTTNRSEAIIDRSKSSIDKHWDDLNNHFNYPNNSHSMDHHFNHHPPPHLQHHHQHETRAPTSPQMLQGAADRQHHHQHHHHHHHETPDSDHHLRASRLHLSNVAEGRHFASNTLDSTGSYDSTLGHGVCAEEEEKLRCQGYEIESAASQGSDSNGIPQDDYVYVLKKVHKRPATAAGGGEKDRVPRETFDHEKQVEVGARVDSMPDTQRYAASLANGPKLRFVEERGASGRFPDWSVLQEERMADGRRMIQSRGWKTDFSDFSGSLMDRRSYAVSTSGCTTSPVTSAVEEAFDRAMRSNYSSQMLPSYKPHEAMDEGRPQPGWYGSIDYHDGRSIRHSMRDLGTNDSWNERASYEGRERGGGQEREYSSTVFGVTGVAKSQTPRREIPSRNPDGRRKPVSSWLELGDDLEQALKYVCTGNSNNYDENNYNKSAGSYYGSVGNFSYPDEGQNFFRENDEEASDKNGWRAGQSLPRRTETGDAVGLIFDAIDQRDHYSSQSEVVYSKPQKKLKRHKTQDRFDDVIFLDLHDEPNSDSGHKRQQVSRKPMRPSNFVQPLRTSLESETQHQFWTGDARSIREAPKIRSKSKGSYSLPGSRENLRRDSSCDEADRGHFATVSEIKDKLFGPNEERAKALLQRERRQVTEKRGFSSKNNKQNSYNRSSETRPSARFEEYYVSGGRSGHLNRSYVEKSEICYSPSSSSNSDVEKDQTYHFNSFGRKLHLQEVPRESISSLARKDVDDMASRRYRITSKLCARSTPDLSARETKSNTRIQTSYPRKSSKAASKERLSKPLQTIREREPKIQMNPFQDQGPHKVNSNDGSSHRLRDHAPVASNLKDLLARRQSLCTGVAKLVNLFEKSISAPNLLDENLFVNSYSNTGDLLFDGTAKDADFVRSSNADQVKQSANKCKRSKKAKIRLLKSSDSGYIESETDSICSSGKEKVVVLSVERKAEEAREKGTVERKYDREGRLRDIKQLREEWLNSSPSQSPSNFVSKKVLPLDTKKETSIRQSSRLDSISRAPYYERTCTITSSGQSAFAKISKPPQPKKLEAGKDSILMKQTVKGKETKGMSSLVEKEATGQPAISKVDPITASKFPSGQIPHSADREKPEIRKSFVSRQGLERFELSDDGSQTDCTDGTIDAILASNQLSTLSPTSTLDCSDFEFYQTASSLRLASAGSFKNKNESGKSCGPTEKMDASLPHKTQLRKSMSDATNGALRESEKRSIKELVDSFELLLCNPFASKSTIST